MADKAKRATKPRVPMTPEIWRAILDRVAAGEMVTAIGREPDMPDASTIFAHAARTRDAAEEYARARESQAHVLAERALAEALKDHEPQKAQLARLRWDALRWHCSKLFPRIYSEKSMHEHSGPGGAPVALRWATEKELADDGGKE